MPSVQHQGKLRCPDIFEATVLLLFFHSSPECITAKEGIVNQESEILPKINKEEIKASPQRAKNIKVPEKDNIVIDAIKVEEIACLIELWSF